MTRTAPAPLLALDDPFNDEVSLQASGQERFLKYPRARARVAAS